MGDKGKKDKGKRELQKKAQVNPKEKRKLKNLWLGEEDSNLVLLLISPQTFREDSEFILA